MIKQPWPCSGAGDGFGGERQDDGQHDAGNDGALYGFQWIHDECPPSGDAVFEFITREVDASTRRAIVTDEARKFKHRAPYTHLLCGISAGSIEP